MLNLVLIQPARLGHQCVACAHLASQTGTPLLSLFPSSNQARTPKFWWLSFRKPDWDTNDTNVLLIFFMSMQQAGVYILVLPHP